MAEKVQLAAKTSKAKENSPSTTRKIESPQSMGSPADQVMYLQRTIGNQAVQRLIKSGALQAKLKIGQPGDKYEQEADTVQQRSEGLSPSQKIVQSKSIFFRPSEKAESVEKNAEVKPEVIPEPVLGKKVSEKRVAPDVDSKTAPERQTTTQTAPEAPTKKEMAGARRGAGGEKPSVSTPEEEKEEKKPKKEPLTKEKEGIGAGEETAEAAPEKPETVSISAEYPEQILEQLINVTPASSVAAYDEAQKVSAEALENQKQQVEQNLPEIPAPTGLPAKETRVKEKGKVAAAAEKPPSAFEGEKSGKEGEEYKFQVEEAPPPPPVKPTVLDGGEADESGKGNTELSRSAQNELNNVHMDTRNISTNAGERPAVDMTGEADPSQLDSFRGESRTKVKNAKVEASKEIYQDFGENDIFPEPTNETLKASKALSSPKTPSGKGGEALSIPSEAIAGLNESLGPVLRERIGEQKEKYDSGKEKFSSDSAKARVDADKQIANLDNETQEKQIEEQNNAKAEVAQSRAEWQVELDSVEQDYQKKASKATEDQREKIAEEKHKGEDEAVKHLEDAEMKAEQEKLKAEEKADTIKKDAENESEGFWGYVESAASALIDGLKTAVNFIYDGLRKAVKLIFEAAKALVEVAIELARMAIVGLIKDFGLILKGLVTVVFVAFPNIAKKINSKIDKVVNVTVDAVNTSADYLKKGVEAVLDFLANTLDKLLGLIQSVYNGIFTVIGMIIRGEFKELMERIGNLVTAAKQMPDHFWGQASEEMLGMNLSKPLPMERTRAPESNEFAAATKEAGALPSADIELLNRPVLSENDITVDNVAQMELDPEFIASLNLQEGKEIEFGESIDQSRSVEAIKAEMLGTAPTTQVAGSASEEVGTAAPAKTQEEIAEEELQDLMAQEPKGGCTKEKQGEPAKENEVPEHMKLGPFTAGQRARYLLHQMKIGIKQWFECNWPWLLAGVVVALLGVIALNILTAGAFLAALPIIMNIVAAIMIGVAIARVTSYVGDYLSHGWAGNISSAAKSLARGLAIGAIELIFALLFNLGAVIKSLKAGLKATAKAAAKATKATVTTAIKNVKELGRLGLQGGKAVVKNGKLIMKGLKNGFGKGIKSLDDMARRLWQRVRFRRFKVRRVTGRRFQLLGYINPWVVLANGFITEVEQNAALGDIVTVPSHVRSGIDQSGVLIGLGKEITRADVPAIIHNITHRNLTKVEYLDIKKLLKYKKHFKKHKNVLKRVTGKKYDWKKHQQEFLDDIQNLIHNGDVKLVGLSTIGKDQPLVAVFRGNGVTIITRPDGEWVTIWRTGEGIDPELDTFMHSLDPPCIPPVSPLYPLNGN